MVNAARIRHNLSDVVGRHTDLKRRGGREVVGLCPFHSERSPSFEVNDAKGTYHCHGCGKGGDAITFLIEKEGMTFRTAVEALSGETFPVIAEEERARRREEDAADRERRLALGRGIWGSGGSTANTPAEVYARSRGITAPLPKTIRFAMTPRWYNHETGEVGRPHPAAICALQDAAGSVVGVQCIFLADGGQRKYERVRADGTKAKAKLTFGLIVGSALRLGPVAAHLVVVEGPEDGWTLMQQLVGKSVWVACGTAMMSRLEYPAGIRSVCFAGDNNAAGRLAVQQAGDAALARGLIPSRAFPEPKFSDWNDQLRGIAA